MATLIAIAAFTSIVLSKLRLPALIGFLITGILINNYVDVPEATGNVVSIFSNLGLIMLMFAIGMEIDLTKMKIQGKFAAMIAVVQIPVMLFTGMIVGSMLGYSSTQSLTFGAILSGASTAVVLAVLKANDVLSQEKMEILILVMIIEDISQVIMISILTPMMDGGDMSTDSLIVLILHIMIFMVGCFTIGLKVIPKIIDWFYARSNDELISLLCIGLVFIFALLANVIGLSVAIGAFLVGVMVGMSKPKHVVEEFVEPLKTLFMAMFFISVGMEVSVDSLLDNIPTILLFYGIFAAFMFVAVNTGYWLANGSARDGWVSAFSMCTMGEFAFIISKLALDKGVFDQAFYSSVIGAAIVSMIILPFLVRFSDKTYTAVNRIAPGFLKRLYAFATVQRDHVYNGLTVVSYKSKARFSKGLTNSAFLVILIILIEITFFFMYDPLADWLTENIGAEDRVWRIGILLANIVVLLEPCRRLAKFFGLTLYIMERGKDYYEGRTGDDRRAPKVAEYFSTLSVGLAITAAIVIIVPNGISGWLHIPVLLVVLVLTVARQMYNYRKIKAEPQPETAE